ncbi:MAG TPA: NYN domain-containing protein, partial [Fluviicoccus sp.]|nr:NYN domain-containing protein [Fluviicoccus sp.]
RQRLYLQALRKHPPCRVSIIEGRMVATTPVLRLVEPLAGIDKVRVHDFVEKQTDVNLACDMLAAAWTGACEQIVLCSNDSDLKAALTTIRRYCSHVRLGLVAPVATQHARHLSRDLTMLVDWAKVLSPVHLSAAQLPDRIYGTAIRRPDGW